MCTILHLHRRYFSGVRVVCIPRTCHFLEWGYHTGCQHPSMVTLEKTLFRTNCICCSIYADIEGGLVVGKCKLSTPVMSVIPGVHTDRLKVIFPTFYLHLYLYLRGEQHAVIRFGSVRSCEITIRLYKSL